MLLLYYFLFIFNSFFVEIDVLSSVFNIDVFFLCILQQYKKNPCRCSHPCPPLHGTIKATYILFSKHFRLKKQWRGVWLNNFIVMSISQVFSAIPEHLTHAPFITMKQRIDVRMRMKMKRTLSSTCPRTLKPEMPSYSSSTVPQEFLRSLTHLEHRSRHVGPPANRNVRNPYNCTGMQSSKQTSRVRKTVINRAV